MKYKIHKQYRLPYYNYASAGLYFVTVCTHKRKHILGKIEKGKLELSPIGRIVEQCWKNILLSSPYASIDSFVIMPNHVHGIIVIENPDEKREIVELKFRPERKSLSVVIRNFKGAASIRSHEQFPEVKIWQSRFYDRIIRDEKELNAVRKYIADNPLKWEEEKNNTDNLYM